tara:strand:- start:370 stop:807 length:438 start_codon:yes stop_codon:yes gene_type:complete
MANIYDQKERESFYEQREREELRRREQRLRDLQELRIQFQRQNQRDYSREDFVPQDPESIKRYEDGVLDSAIKKYGPQGDTRYLTPEEARILKKRMLEQDLERFKEEEPLPPPPKPRKPRGQTVAKGGPIKQYAKGGGVRKPRTL